MYEYGALLSSAGVRASKREWLSMCGSLRVRVLRRSGTTRPPRHTSMADEDEEEVDASFLLFSAHTRSALARQQEQERQKRSEKQALKRKRCGCVGVGVGGCVGALCVALC